MANKNYDSLKVVLNNLFNQLYFPIGGSDDGSKSIWMEESSQKRLVTIATETGFVTISGDGHSVKQSDVNEVEALYITYFRMEDSLQATLEALLAKN